LLGVPIVAPCLFAEDEQKEEEKILLRLDQEAHLSARRGDGPGKPIVGLKIDQADQPLTGDLLAPLKSLKHLRSLEIKCREIDADALASLADLRQLQSLKLDILVVTDASLAGLKDLTNLRALEFYGEDVSDKGLANLERLTRLESLRMDVPAVTDAGLAHLANLTEVRELSLILLGPAHGIPRVSDKALAHLRRMTKLRRLYVRGMNLLGDGLKNLKDMDDLEYVKIHYGRVEGDPVVHMPPAKRLRWLEGFADASKGLREYPGGKLVLEIRGASAWLRDAKTGEAVTPLLKHRLTDRAGGWKITCWAFSPDGKLLVTGTGYAAGQGGERESMGEVRVWEVPAGKLLAKASSGYVHGVAFLPDSQTLAVAAEVHLEDGP
jgi:hypothetical protein